MKKLLSYFMIFLLILIPSYVKAEECDSKSIKIQSITLTKKSDTVEEQSEVSVKNNKVNLDLEMHEVGDYAEYKIEVKNTSKENYYFDENSIENASDYIQYEVHSKDNSNVIKPGKEKEYQLKVIYKAEVDKTEFRSGKYVENKNTIMNLSTRDSLIEIITNPQTSQSKVFIVILGITFIGLLSLKKKKKISLFLLSLFLIPLTAYAVCKYNLEIDSTITINKVLPNYCTFDGELVQGAEYVNGQYTYRYMQEGGYENGWNNIDSEGWGVKLTNRYSTDDVTTPLCAYINDKPVVSMSYMFFNSQAENIDMSSFYTSNVKSMEYMFEYAKAKELDFSSFDTSNVTNMNYMFYVTQNLKELDLRYFDTSKLKKLYTPFYALTNLNTLNIDNWNLSNIEENLNLLHESVTVENMSAYNLKLPKNSSFVFSNGKKLKNIEGTNTWDMSKVEDASYMFSNDENLEYINFDGLDITNITNMNKIFEKCNKLKNIKLSNLDFSGFDNARFSEKLSIQNLPSLEVLDFSNSKFYNNLEYAFSLNETPNIKEIVLKNIDTENVTNMNHTFYLNKFLKKLDISDLDTQNVTNFTDMISYCFNLEEIELGNIDTSNVETMEGMFRNDNALKSIDISKFNTRNLKNAESMFYGDNELETANVSNLIHKNIESFQYLFGGNKKLKTLIMDNWEPPLNIYAGQYSLQFSGRPNVIDNIYMRNWKLPENFEYMVNRYYLQIDEVNNLDVSGWDLSNTKSIAMLFKDGYHIRHISGLETWDTSNITNMSELFKYCYVLDEVDMSSFDYSKVTRMDYMFELDHELKKVNMGNFNAEALENANHMFSQADGIEEIMFKSISTPKLNDATYMFYGLPKLKSLDLRGMSTKNAKNMYYMFAGNKSLISLDLSTFEINTSQHLDGMFSNCNSLTTAYARTQEDADRLNATSYKPDNVVFIVRP